MIGVTEREAGESSNINGFGDIPGPIDFGHTGTTKHPGMRIAMPEVFRVPKEVETPLKPTISH